ncbi:HlyD family type I secretion periplasmic adaptor subunit [Herbaspirillum sp. YR522]|uniref:HlyD family type I secretion periplasmic adaptor subunit n=1 Tax=Herbaspirillum sp. YR522 TaxID=1144342 RepID=UPI00026F4A37|nr:HlyD family type I secretion periplasmic adaptor subunit [Herbaspirillum sp. YR522]EJN10301.1 type I secretion membrane fusion protein, HlyD family [Herbaspirillum sp. YR522]
MNTIATQRAEAAREEFRSMEDIEREPPGSILRLTLYAVLGLFVILLIWAIVGKLDIIASAEGRLVPQTFVKIVQPADSGVVAEIRVKEGQRVEAGQVLLRMDTKISDADDTELRMELANRSLQLRRIDAELSGAVLAPRSGDNDDLFLHINAQYLAHRQNFLDTQGQEQQVLRKAQHELASAKEILGKLRQTAPILKQQADAYVDLGKDGYAGQLMVQEKQREYLERAQDLKAQESTVAGLDAAIGQSQKRIEQITSNYRSTLLNERIEAEGQRHKIEQDLIKQNRKAELLELKAPQAGFVKDLATHTVGTVVTPGTILLTLVPENEPLIAEVQIKNDDVGFIHEGQNGKIKLVAYPFQKYGMIEGKVIHLGADSQEASQAQSGKQGNVENKNGAAQQTYKALIELNRQALENQGALLKLVSGMQVIAEINQGQRTVMEYLLSPVQKAFHESARER